MTILISAPRAISPLLRRYGRQFAIVAEKTAFGTVFGGRTTDVLCRQALGLG